MKFNKQKIVFYLNIFYITITAMVNLYGFFTLPDTVASHFSLTGKVTSRMPTPAYLLLTFAIILILSITAIKKEGDQKIKYIFVDTLIVIINIVVILLQI